MIKQLRVKNGVDKGKNVIKQKKGVSKVLFWIQVLGSKQLTEIKVEEVVDTAIS